MKALSPYNLETRAGKMEQANKSYRLVLIECRKTAYIMSKKFSDIPYDGAYYDQCCKINPFFFILNLKS
jgi:hypothetical protein